VAADRPPSTVVFDVDDTLYLERDYVASGFAVVAEVVRHTFGVDGFYDVAWRLFTVGHRRDIFDRALAELGIPYAEDAVATLVRTYRTHRPRISLLPDAAHALGELSRQGIGLAILTDGAPVGQAAKVAALGVDRLTDLVVLTGSYDGDYGKPHPRGYAEIAARSGAVRLAYVADNPAKDFQAPHKLGWTTIRIRRPGALHAACPHTADVDHAIDSLDELLTVLRSCGFVNAGA
jgi:putative hydrolase of the HAD superfamily